MQLAGKGTRNKIEDGAGGRRRRGSAEVRSLILDSARALFAALLTEQDVDIMAWAVGTSKVPERFQGPMMDAFQRLDFIKVNK